MTTKSLAERCRALGNNIDMPDHEWTTAALVTLCEAASRLDELVIERARVMTDADKARAEVVRLQSVEECLRLKERSLGEMLDRAREEAARLRLSIDGPREDT